jgi:CRP/FNR family transcriptional regulator, cyclic AMP receptor protein
VNSLERQRCASVVRHHGWLAETPRAFQDLLLPRCDLLRLKPKQNVYEVGDDAGGLFGLVEGRLEVHLAVRGLQPTLAFIGAPGFWVGDAAAVRGHPRLVSVIAGTRCRVLRLRRAELFLLGANYPQTWAHVTLMMARNVERCVNIIDALKRHDPIERVAAMLLNLLEEGPLIELSQSDLAAMTSLGRGSVNAGLKALQARGLIRRRYRSIEVLNGAGLRQFAGRTPRSARRTAAA